MEDEISYAVVKFKHKKNPRPQAQQREETVYEEVKVQNETIKPKDGNDSSRPVTKTEAEGKRFQLLCCGFGISCIVLLLVIIGLRVHHQKKVNELNQLKANQTALLEEIHQLTNLNNNLRSNYEHVTTQVNNVTQANTDLENKIRNLTAEKQNLKRQNQELQVEKNNLTEQIQNMEESQNELNISRAQWTIDAYCPLKYYVSGRTCESCEKNWIRSWSRSSCYEFNNVEPTNWRTWDEARDDCRGKGSDLNVVHGEQENQIMTLSRIRRYIPAYWIGLRAVDGKWQWIDGHNKLNIIWMKQLPANESQCVSYHYNRGWESSSCSEKKGWICEKKALTLFTTSQN